MHQCASSPLPGVRLRRPSRRWPSALFALAIFVSGGVDAQQASYGDPSSQRQKDQEDAAARRQQEIERANRDAAQWQSPAQPPESPRTPESRQGATGNGVPFALPRGIPIDTLAPKYLAALQSSTSDCEQLSRLARDPNSELVSYSQQERSCLQSCMDLAGASYVACVFFSRSESERLALESNASARLRAVEQRLAEGSGCGCLAATDAVRKRVAPIVEFIQQNRSALQTAERAAEKARRDRLAQEQKAAAEAEASNQRQTTIMEAQARAARLLNSADDWLPRHGEERRRAAEQKARDALALVPGASATLFELARLTSDPVERSRLLEKVVSNLRGSIYDSPLLALAYRGLGNHSEAAKVAMQALAGPQFPRMRVGLTALAKEPEIIQSGGIDAFTRSERLVLAGELRKVGARGLFDAEYLTLKKMEAVKRLARLRPLMVKAGANVPASVAARAGTAMPCTSGSVVECHDALHNAYELSRPDSDAAFWTVTKGACIEGSLTACFNLSRGYHQLPPSKPVSNLPEAVGYLVDACERSAAGCGLLGSWLYDFGETFKKVRLKDGTLITEWRARAYRIACQIPQENNDLQRLCEHDGVFRDERSPAIAAQGFWPPWYNGYSYF